MQTSQKPEKKRNANSWTGVISIAAIPVLVLITIAMLAIRYPAVETWISDAAQSEFALSGIPASDPTPVTQPPQPLHAAK